MKIVGLYVGKKRPFGPRSQFSGIDKRPLESGEVDELGFVDDVQVDKRFHGGPERALHQYALKSYERIIKRFPLLHKTATPGSIGENLTINGMNDTNVCIGDIYQLGDIKVQVSSPRIPCWKISHKMNMPDLDKYVAEKQITGWYYRVLEVGKLSIGDEVSRLERPNENLSISRFIQINNDKNASPEVLLEAANAVGLDPEWKERLERRAESKKATGSGDYEV